MKKKPSDFDNTKFFDFDAENRDDPYERGFADKLYDGYEEDPGDMEIQVDLEDDAPYFPEEMPNRPSPEGYVPRTITPYPQVYNPRKKRSFQQEYTPRSQPAYEEPEQYDYEQPRPNRRSRPEPAPAQNIPVPKKKHGFFGFFLKLLFTLVILLAAAILVLHLLAKPPKGNENLGVHSDESCTILLAGTDKSGDRTDTIMLLNINRENGKISLMSIPRDTKVNSTYTPHSINIAYGVNGKGAEGMDSLMDYVSDCVGFRPDGYVLLELDVFIDLVNMLGGVDFEVPMDMFYEDASQDLFIDLKEGLQALDGEKAMELVRFRYGYADADIGRGRVQRDFMKSAMDQWFSWKNIWKAPAALAMLRSKSQTDLSVGNFVWLAEAVLSCGTDDMEMTVVPFYFSGSYLIIDAGQNYLDLLNSRFNPYSEPITWDDLYIAQ